jgi:hypothetical protein
VRISKLKPPCVGWQQDLPGPNDPLAEAPRLLWLAPNHIDDICLELPRKALSVRGVLLFFAILMGGVAICHVIFSLIILTTTNLIRSGALFESALYIIAIIASVVLEVWIAVGGYRTDVSTPQDLPIRFNRARRKVYVYGFHSSWWNPFSRWYVTTTCYDWDDLRAEKWKVRATTANGGLIIKEGVSIAVVRSDTNDVIERFDLSTRAGNTSNVWAYVCHYMQHGRQGLVPCEALPLDNNDPPPFRLGPKVKWPEAMDAESRTSP